MKTAVAELKRNAPSPALVAVAAWLLPGGGYWLLGERSRGVTVGVTVITLFVLGLLIGGLRVIETPFYNRFGQGVGHGPRERQPDLLGEVRAKPWSVAQIMTGPVGIAGGAASVWAARPDPSQQEADDAHFSLPRSRGAESHSRVNEIAVLYTAVAGMLNLLAIIDAAHRAGRMREGT